ncbi:hypothetical protein SAJA_13855 [Salinisphaera japonica YTM-1]|uniref:Uncharacterized protein n=1 Tax=Salinisphaera japonica YTM-1 TaxID=1209778 RepID=A0A423PHD9_9GAMM|nr:hypothetical protein SAJA_13855 [Salinisphaera japonica YTM-1]
MVAAPGGPPEQRRIAEVLYRLREGPDSCMICEAPF